MIYSWVHAYSSPNWHPFYINFPWVCILSFFLSLYYKYELFIPLLFPSTWLQRLICAERDPQGVQNHDLENSALEWWCSLVTITDFIRYSIRCFSLGKEKFLIRFFWSYLKWMHFYNHAPLAAGKLWKAHLFLRSVEPLLYSNFCREMSIGPLSPPQRTHSRRTKWQ